MQTYKKVDFPVADARRFLEPGPVVPVSSASKGETNIMTMGRDECGDFGRVR